MATMKQVGLLAAGCQPWNSDVCAANGDRFAYCATLAIYVYQLDRQFNEFKLQSIMSEHKKTITAISWSPRDVDLIVSSSTDNQVIVYNIAEQSVVAKISVAKSPATSLGWCRHERDSVSFVTGRGPLYMWNFTSSTTSSSNNNAANLTVQKEASNFMSDICQFRWHPKKNGKMAFGHQDGSVSLFCTGQKPQKHVLRPEELEGTEEEDPVAALEWDPLSVEYLLLANTHSGVRMVDTAACSVIMNFVLPSAAAQVHTLAWISSAPGMFVTGDSHTGTLRIWTVSKSSPLENMKLKQTGFHALHVFHTTTPVDADDSSPLNSPTSPGGLSSSGPLLSPAGRYTLPPAHAVCTFLDGGIGLYDLGRRRWYFLRDQGHIETIFDCKFKPDNSDYLATGSFDGTIKIWDVNTLTAVHSSPGNEGVIYSLSWAPADLNCIAASTSRHGAFVWDVSKGRIIKRFTEHGKASVYSIAWNHKDSRRVATAGADGYCIVRQVDGQQLAKYKHPGAVYGCDWSPNNKDMIATGCEDKCVRVFYMPSSTDSAMRTFSGHTAKVFHVKWSPLRDGLLASGSDDGTIRVWDYTKEACIVVLQGHTAPVRGLLWNPEIPYLFVSGSWDYSIRLWDIRDGACIDTVYDHGADVYGLTSHPAKPFTMASCSRDSTVRVWNLTPLIQPLEMNLLAAKPWDEVIASPEHSMALGTPPLLCGKASKELRQKVDKLHGPNARLQILQMFSLFFASPGGTDNLWELVSVVKGLDDSLLSGSYSKGIMHMKHITKFKAAHAQHLEMVKTSKFGGGIGAPSRDECLRKAAAVEVRLGNLQRYCELLVELGEWERALAVAPGVSMAYWKSLAQRRATQLMQEDSDLTVPYCVATGMVDKLCEFFSVRGQLQDAMVTAVASYEGSIVEPVVTPKPRHNGNVQNGDQDEAKQLQLVRCSSEALGDWHFRNGSSVLAACSHLAVDDCQGAVAKLVRGNELELAASVGTVLGNTPQLTYAAIEMLSRRCERIGRWELAVELLLTVPESDIARAKCCARCSASLAEIDDLHDKAGFPSTDDCIKEAEKAKSKGDLYRTVMYYIMSQVPEQGLEIGLKFVKDKMSASSWQADDVYDMLHLMAAIQSEKLQQHKCSRFRNELMILCAYVGALVALRRGYEPVVQPLLTHVRFLMHREPVNLILSESLVMSELDAFVSHQAVKYYQDPHSSQKKEASITVEQQNTYTALLQKAGTESSSMGGGQDCSTGSQYPSHTDVHQSYFTQQRIQGAAFFLEDGRSAIGINEALMWAKVNPFSPLGSGVRINPF